MIDIERFKNLATQRGADLFLGEPGNEVVRGLRTAIGELLDELESCRKCVKSHENLNENMQALNRTLLDERAKLIDVLKASDALLRFMRKYDKKKGVAIANALWIVDLCNSLERKIEACADIPIEEDKSEI